MAVTVRKATVQDALEFGPNVREADRQETLAHLGIEPSVALPIGVASGGEHWVLKGDREETFGMFGVTSSHTRPEVGVVWMMLSDDIHRYRYPFLKHGFKWLDVLHYKYPLLGNYVDARNDLHIKWLKFLGFQFLQLIPEFGPEKRPFYEIIHIR